MRVIPSHATATTTTTTTTTTIARMVARPQRSSAPPAPASDDDAFDLRHPLGWSRRRDAEERANLFAVVRRVARRANALAYDDASGRKREVDVDGDAATDEDEDDAMR